jgi:hypothetical protein
MSGLSGLNASFGSAPGVPGFLDNFTMGLLGQGQAQSGQAMTNRYNQLGLSGNPQGGPPQAAAAAGRNMTSGGAPTTALSMDLGQTPSLTGGLDQMFSALQGQLENSALNQPAPLNSNKSLGSLGGGLLGGLF